jgi:hypothetical protein
MLIASSFSLCLLLLFAVRRSLTASVCDDSAMALDVHVVSLLPSSDPLAVHNVRLDRSGDGAAFVRVVGQLFNESEMTVFSSWPSELSWRVRNRFVIEAEASERLVRLFRCLRVTVHVHSTFVELVRDYGRVVSTSSPRSDESSATFCACWSELPAPTRQRHVLTVCSLIRDEARNLEEWLAHHERMGIAHFRLYDDGSADATKELLATRIAGGIVTLTDWSRASSYWRQLSAINDCVFEARETSDWVAVLDVDEFLVPAASRSVVDLLSTPRFAAAGAVRVAWWMFSDSVEPEQEAERLVTSRYLWHSAACLGTVTLLDEVQILAGKSLVRPQQVRGFETSHFATLLDGALSVDADAADELVIRHYAMRDAGQSNRWSDTRAWKKTHHDALQKLWSVERAEPLSAALQ